MPRWDCEDSPSCEEVRTLALSNEESKAGDPISSSVSIFVTSSSSSGCHVAHDSPRNGVSSCRREDMASCFSDVSASHEDDDAKPTLRFPIKENVNKRVESE